MKLQSSGRGVVRLRRRSSRWRLLCIAGPGKIEYSNNAFTNEVVADAPNSTSYSSGSQNGRTYLSTTSSMPQLFFTWEKTADPTRTGQGIQFLSDTRDHVLRQVMPDGKFLGHRFGLMFDGQREMYVCELQNDAGTPSATIQVANNPPEKLEFKVAPPQKAIDCWKKKAEEFDAANAK